MDRTSRREIVNVSKWNYFRLVALIVDIAQKVIHDFIKTRLLNGDNFDDFLDMNKHVIFHSYEPIGCCTRGCCAGSSKQIRISRDQFEKLYEKDETQFIKPHRLYSNRRLVQTCICGIKAIGNNKVEILDISLASHLIQKFGTGIMGVDTWIKSIRETRNEIFHISDMQLITTDMFKIKWQKLEGSILGISNLIGNDYAQDISQKIKDLETRFYISDGILMHERLCHDFWTSKRTEFWRLRRKEIDKMSSDLYTTDEQKRLVSTVNHVIEKMEILDTTVDEIVIKVFGDTEITKSVNKPDCTEKQAELKTIPVLVQLDIPYSWDASKICNAVEQMRVTMRHEMPLQIKDFIAEDMTIFAEIVKKTLKRRDSLKSEVNMIISDLLKMSGVDTSKADTVQVNISLPQTTTDILLETHVTSNLLETPAKGMELHMPDSLSKTPIIDITPNTHVTGTLQESHTTGALSKQLITVTLPEKHLKLTPPGTCAQNNPLETYGTDIVPETHRQDSVPLQNATNIRQGTQFKDTFAEPTFTDIFPVNYLTDTLPEPQVPGTLSEKHLKLTPPDTCAQNNPLETHVTDIVQETHRQDSVPLQNATNISQKTQLKDTFAEPTFTDIFPVNSLTDTIPEPQVPGTLSENHMTETLPRTNAIENFFESGTISIIPKIHVSGTLSTKNVTDTPAESRCTNMFPKIQTTSTTLPTHDTDISLETHTLDTSIPSETHTTGPLPEEHVIGTLPETGATYALPDTEAREYPEDTDFRICTKCSASQPEYKCYECDWWLCESCCEIHLNGNNTTQHHVHHRKDKYQFDFQIAFNDLQISDIKIIPDEMLIISEYTRNQILTCDIAGKIQRQISLPGKPVCMVKLDQRRVVVGFSDQCEIVIVDVQSERIVSKISTRHTCKILANVRNMIVIVSEESGEIFEMSREIFTRLHVVEKYTSMKHKEWSLIYHLYNTVQLDEFLNCEDVGMDGQKGITAIDDKHGLKIVPNVVEKIDCNGRRKEIMIKCIPRSYRCLSLCFLEKLSLLFIAIDDTVHVYKQISI